MRVSRSGKCQNCANMTYMSVGLSQDRGCKTLHGHEHANRPVSGAIHPASWSCRQGCWCQHLWRAVGIDVDADARLRHLAVRLGHQLDQRVQRDFEPRDVLQTCATVTRDIVPRSHDE